MLTWVSGEGKLKELHLTHSTQSSKLYPRLRHQEYNLTAPRHAAGVRAPSESQYTGASVVKMTPVYSMYSAVQYVQCEHCTALCTVPAAQ